MVSVRSTKECRTELDAQVHLLRKASHEFDQGDLHEFRNIARALRVILTGDQHGNDSLIRLAGRAAAAFIDTGTYPHRLSLSPYFALAGIVLGPRTVGCRALLDDAPRRRLVNLDEWLERESIIDDREGCVFNRLRLIKVVANVAGGTHYPADIRHHFAKLQALAVTARRESAIKVPYQDIEKHSLRQIAHEVLKSLDPSYGRLGRFEGGAFLIAGQEFFLFPGRKVVLATTVRQKPEPAIFLATPGHGFDGISGPRINIPYEGTPMKAPCPCLSGLRFRDCCSEAREIDPRIVAEFERKHGLGAHRPVEDARQPGQ